MFRDSYLDEYIFFFFHQLRWFQKSAVLFFFSFVNAALMPAWQNPWEWLIKQQCRSSAGAAQQRPWTALGLRGWLQPGEMRTNKLSEAITSSRQWTRECTNVSVHQHLAFSSLCPGALEPHHRLTVDAAVTRPTDPPESSCSRNRAGAELATMERVHTENSASGHKSSDIQWK